jgi:hypothetical protein
MDTSDCASRMNHCNGLACPRGRRRTCRSARRLTPLRPVMGQCRRACPHRLPHWPTSHWSACNTQVWAPLCSPAVPFDHCCQALTVCQWRDSGHDDLQRREVSETPQAGGLACSWLGWQKSQGRGDQVRQSGKNHARFAVHSHGGARAMWGIGRARGTPCAATCGAQLRRARPWQASGGGAASARAASWVGSSGGKVEGRAKVASRRSCWMQCSARGPGSGRVWGGLGLSAAKSLPETEG